MAGVTLETAQSHLEMWLDAEEALTTHQSYKHGSRSLTRADLGQVREQINFWQAEVRKLSGRRNRMYRFVPRDL